MLVKQKIILPISLFFVYYEIRSNHFRKLIEVLVIYVFQIQHIVLIFVAKIKEFFIYYKTKMMKTRKFLLEQVIIHFLLLVVYYEDFELNDDVFLSNVLHEYDVFHFHHFQTKINYFISRRKMNREKFLLEIK